MKIIGLMSGTSADGIDAALVDVTTYRGRPRARLHAFVCIPHPAALRDAILRVCHPERGVTPDLCALDHALGERFAEAAIEVARAAGVPLTAVRAIASHGQTVWHQPTPREIGGVRITGTLQIGAPAVIAVRTGCTVVSNFRAADMAVGGQGAPLVPFADWALLSSPTEARAVQNIGGIANATHLPRAAGINDVTAFDTGPGNVLIDALVRRFTAGERIYDDNGDWAARGQPLPAVLAWILADPFFAARPPKSTGRELFSETYVDRLLVFARTPARTSESAFQADLLATVTCATAESIRNAYARWLVPRGGVQTVIVGGGGCRNHTLMRLLGEQLAPARVTTHSDFGIDDDAKEALAFAVLAHETLRGRPSNVPSATGASRAVVLGSVTPGNGRRV